jgi:low affinity Fe/Cu permease
MTRDERPRLGVGEALEGLAGRVTLWTGGSWAFAVALATIIVWGVTGPVFRFSDTWQLVINTGTTIITFLMVFLIQRSQNKDSHAVHLKLNEIVAALQGASNRLINVEDLTETEIRLLHGHYQRLVEMAKRDASLTESHSVEEADQRHRAKTRLARQATGHARAEGGPSTPGR